MAFYISTALDNQTYNAVRGPVSGVASLQGGYIAIYSGTQPASADAAATGTLLVKITNSSGAFTAGAYQTTDDDNVCAPQCSVLPEPETTTRRLSSTSKAATTRRCTRRIRLRPSAKSIRASQPRLGATSRSGTRLPTACTWRWRRAVQLPSTPAKPGRAPPSPMAPPAGSVSTGRLPTPEVSPPPSPASTGVLRPLGPN